ncbi:hypothetical protein DL764_006020 [Monosporascus ibericus]|uniref:Uncharacterized protein n=1 Tax=Monosporascus ibericus TaxID=155417 RepID=A0A4Q4T693_9PEZI|nr:hypothetical protein DL764_006020 [Monosporascus ibericus]
MYPITCTVVDFDGIGLQGMYVLLDCSRRDGSVSKKFESFTDSQGIIEKWFGFADPLIQLKSVDVADFDDVCLTFSTAEYFGHLQTLWTTIQAHFDPTYSREHAIKLQFGPEYRTYNVRHMPSSPLQSSSNGLQIMPTSPFPSQDGQSRDEYGVKVEEGEIPDSIYFRPTFFSESISATPPQEPPRILTSIVPLSEPSLFASPRSLSTVDIVSEAISPLVLSSPEVHALRSPIFPPTTPRRRAKPGIRNSPYPESGRITRSRKRKIVFEDEVEQPPRKRRRFE